MKWPVVVLNSLFLCACVDVEVGDLTSFIVDIKSQQYPMDDSLPELIDYTPLTFTQQQARSPFLKPNLLSGAVGNIKTERGCLQPDVNREKESLESFSLGDLHMRGTLKINQQLWAIVETPNGFIYKVKAGNYIGLNNGKVVSVAENAIKLTELKIGRSTCWEKQAAEIKLILK